MLSPEQRSREPFEGGNEWTPSISLRPHHVLTDFETQSAIAGRKTRLRTPLKTLYSIMQRQISSDPSGYISDVVGKSTRDVLLYRRTVNEFLDQLRSLPDEDVVHLDLQPDGMCESCIAGRHCSGTNYRSLYSPRDTAKLETNYLSQIGSELRLNGFEEGKDFIFTPTTHILFDFHGRALKEQGNPRQITVTFNSMLVKVGALRGII